MRGRGGENASKVDRSNGLRKIATGGATEGGRNNEGQMRRASSASGGATAQLAGRRG